MTTDTNDIKIRAATPLDEAAATDLLRPFVEQRKLLPRILGEMSELLTGGFVAVDGRRVVGFAALEIYSRKLAEIRGLVVADGYQGRKIGKRLVESCIQLARDRDIMEVMAISSSETFFRSCGFEYTLPEEKKAFFLQIRSRH